MAVAIALGLCLLFVLSAILLHPMFPYPAPINYARWLIWSGRYKAQVLAASNPANGELRHIEWDGWGWAGMDTTVYLVFDPTNALSKANSHGPGKFPGIPCEIYSAKRLEDKWYTVQFYTDREWRRDC